MKLKKGDKAPEFNCIDQDEKTISLSDFKGKKLVLFFYPKDNTPTCTVEACNLRDHYRELREAGLEVIGVSADSPRKHQNFIHKYKLPYRLISDQSHEMLADYGVWAEKKLFGKKYMGIIRTTMLIDENGVITEIIDKIKAKKAARQILEAL